MTLLSHQLLNSNSGWFPVVCLDRVDLHAVGVTSVTTSENTQALRRRSCNRRGDGILCCYSLLSSLHFHLLPLVICHIVIVNTYLALRIWDFCRLLCLHRLPLEDLVHIDSRQSGIERRWWRKQPHAPWRELKLLLGTKKGRSHLKFSEFFFNFSLNLR